jgi:enamine deaminase RidA (YjgF/YER057c/UK114 family)
MTLRRINPDELAPAVGFSHAVVAEGTKIIFLAGQTAVDATGNIVGETIVEQFRLALSNILIALAAAGGTPAQLAKLTIYSVDPENYRSNSREISVIWKELVGREYPAMALVGVVRLWDLDAQVEIEGIAVIP